MRKLNPIAGALLLLLSTTATSVANTNADWKRPDRPLDGVSLSGLHSLASGGAPQPEYRRFLAHSGWSGFQGNTRTGR